MKTAEEIREKIRLWERDADECSRIDSETYRTAVEIFQVVIRELQWVLGEENDTTESNPKKGGDDDNNKRI